MRWRIALIFAGVVAWPVMAMTVSLQFHMELSPQYRVPHQQGFLSEAQWNEFYLLMDETMQVSEGHWYAEIKPQIRGVQSKAVSAVYPWTATSETSKRVLNSRRRLEKTADRDIEFDLDRADLRYQFTGGDVYIGRRPISLGVLRFMPVWNKLTMPLIFGAGPQWMENPDSVGASVQIDRWAFRLFGARGDRPKTDDLVLLESKYYGDTVELQFLTGSWWQHAAAGFALSTDWRENTLRLETLAINSVRDKTPLVQIGAGFESALNSHWILVAEYLHQNLGRRLGDGYGIEPPNRFMALSGRDYVLPRLSYQWGTAWNFGFGALVNVLDPSAVALTSADYAWSDYVSLSLKIRWPLGRARSEFSKTRYSDPYGRTAGPDGVILGTLSVTL